MDAPINPKPLYDKAAEEAFIGSLLIDPERLRRLNVKAADLYFVRNQHVLEAMLEITARNETPDMVTIPAELERSGKMAAVGMPALIELAMASPNIFNVDSYEKIIRDFARRRSALAVAQRIALAAYSDNVDNEVEQAVEGYRKDRTGGGRLHHWREDIQALDEEISERVQNPRDVWGMPTGFADYDRMMGGAVPGAMLIIIGAPAMGKSILAHNMAMNLAKAEHPGAVFSLEMTRRDITRRNMSVLSGVNTRAMKTGRMTSDDLSAYYQSIGVAEQLPIYISDDAALTVQTLRKELARAVEEYGIEWFVLDYLMLMTGPGKDDTERSAYLSRHVKTMTTEFNLFGITVNSVVKDGMADAGDAAPNAPSQKHVRGSGQVIHDADVIGELTRHIPKAGEAANPRLRTFTVTKAREMEGGAGYFHLVKHDTVPVFQNYAGQTVNLNGVRK